MDRIYKYNSDANYKPNGGRYLQIMSAKDLYIQNITVAEHDGHSNSFQVKFPNIFTNYLLGAVRVEDQIKAVTSCSTHKIDPQETDG